MECRGGGGDVVGGGSREGSEGENRNGVGWVSGGESGIGGISCIDPLVAGLIVSGFYWSSRQTEVVSKFRVRTPC